jgi:hypothetical protein
MQHIGDGEGGGDDLLQGSILSFFHKNLGKAHNIQVKIFITVVKTQKVVIYGNIWLQ